jgi:hypothetical protein
MFRSAAIIRELTFESGYRYTYVKTIGRITSLCVMRWCGSTLMLPHHRIMFNISVTSARLKCTLPDDGRWPKHVGAIVI